MKVKTLLQAHEAVRRLRPAPGAHRHVWCEYYRQSAEVYRHVADVDQDHHHEAMFWVSRDLQRADEFSESLQEKSASKGA
ncbi:AMED_5909 family protein [Allokutzneria sp. NRRL B-24872]|uniref:AMED_5909 family protein n=1 Tax=Allokutzneria sp. NRRL B-24872 TaxID=1137961 RepID=UPI000A3A4ABC|nr:AMED_5909 family protein [Allokutzneria sp. NRRL B-24872]